MNLPQLKEQLEATWIAATDLLILINDLIKEIPDITPSPFKPNATPIEDPEDNDN